MHDVGGKLDGSSAGAGSVCDGRQVQGVARCDGR